MLPNQVGRCAARRTSHMRGVFPKLGLRHKSEPSRHVDDFPYKYLNQRDVSHMSAEMESTTRLPLRSFFAQHRPLMPFARPPSRQEILDDTKWVHVPANHGRHPLFMAEDRPAWSVIPESVAHQIGPFDREAIMNTKRNQLRGESNGETGHPILNVGKPKSVAFDQYSMNPTEVQSVLNKRFPILMQHLQKMASSDGEVHFIPLTLDKPGNETEDFDDEVQATSVQRKRKLKMNRHKYRKRLKEQRTKRRRLGK